MSLQVATSAFGKPDRGEQTDWPPEWPLVQFGELGDHGRPAADSDVQAARTVRLTLVSEIEPRPVRWTWQDRVPRGEVTLTPGKGGVGKSTFHAWMIAHLTRGSLIGVHYGTPKTCIIAASEDSWERTIVPRLIVAGADMDLIYRVDVITETDRETSLTLPVDCVGLEAEIVRVGAVLLSVDPLMSTISGALDTHKDRDVRQVLEPLGRLADRTGCAVLGNAHFNKSAGSDPMSLIMGSAAFGNVARAALGFAQDTDTDDGSCVISQVKNNLGRLDLPSLRYRIEEASVDTSEGPAYVGKLVMLGESDRSVSDILRDHGDGDDQEERDYAMTWLRDLLKDGPVTSVEVYRAAKAAGLSKDQAKRAKKKLSVDATHPQIDGPWYWSLPDQGSDKGAKGAGFEPPAPLRPLSAPLADGGGLARCAICDRPLDAALGDESTHPTCASAGPTAAPMPPVRSVPTPADLFSNRLATP
jgi:AAA domain